MFLMYIKILQWFPIAIRLKLIFLFKVYSDKFYVKVMLNSEAVMLMCKNCV